MPDAIRGADKGGTSRHRAVDRMGGTFEAPQPARYKPDGDLCCRLGVARGSIGGTPADRRQLDAVRGFGTQPRRREGQSRLCQGVGGSGPHRGGPADLSEGSDP